MRGRRSLRLKAGAEAVLASAGMVAFAVGAARGVSWLAAAGLALPVAAFTLSLRTERSALGVLGLTNPPRRTWGFLLCGAALGGVLAILHRWAWADDAVPGSLRGFAFVAMAVGAAEEVVYRGYVQGRVGAALGLPHARATATKATGRPGRWAATAAAIALAAAAHAAYKAALFSSPPPGVAIDMAYLVVWTVAGGVAFGVPRSLAASAWPAVLAHVTFDLIVYGDAAQAPWWVWR